MSIENLYCGEQLPITLTGHTHNIRALAFSKDGTKLASASDDKTIRVWTVRTQDVAKIVGDRVNDQGLEQEEWENIFGGGINYISYKNGDDLTPTN